MGSVRIESKGLWRVPIIRRILRWLAPVDIEFDYGVKGYSGLHFISPYSKTPRAMKARRLRWLRYKNSPAFKKCMERRRKKAIIIKDENNLKRFENRPSNLATNLKRFYYWWKG